MASKKENNIQLIKQLCEKHGFEHKGSSKDDMISSLLLIVVKLQEKLDQAPPTCACEHTTDDGEGNFTRVDSPTIKKELSEMKAKLRIVEDTTDYNWQRNLKGNIILNFIKKEDSPSQIDLGAEAYKKRILSILDERFGVSVPPLDIMAMHPLKSGKNHIIKFGNRCPGSAYEKIVTAIKTGRKYVDKKDEKDDKTQAEPPKPNDPPQPQPVQAFLTFQFTKKRLQLINELRDMKRNKLITKFTSDENGTINVIVRPGTNRICLTFDFRLNNSKTFTVSELKEFVKGNGE